MTCSRIINNLYAVPFLMRKFSFKYTYVVNCCNSATLEFGVCVLLIRVHLNPLRVLVGKVDFFRRFSRESVLDSGTARAADSGQLPRLQACDCW